MFRRCDPDKLRWPDRMQEHNRRKTATSLPTDTANNQEITFQLKQDNLFDVCLG